MAEKVKTCRIEWPPPVELCVNPDATPEEALEAEAAAIDLDQYPELIEGYTKH